MPAAPISFLPCCTTVATIGTAGARGPAAPALRDGGRRRDAEDSPRGRVRARLDDRDQRVAEIGRCDLVRLGRRAADRRARAPSQLQRAHWKLKPDGFGSQRPGSTRTVAPSTESPETAGRRLQRERRRFAGDRADEARVGGRRAVRVGGADLETERVADVGRADARRRSSSRRGARRSARPSCRSDTTGRRRRSSPSRSTSPATPRRRAPCVGGPTTAGPADGVGAPPRVARSRRRGQQAPSTTRPRAASKRGGQETARALRTSARVPATVAGATCANPGLSSNLRSLPWAALLLAVVALAVPSSASPSKGLVVGLFDDAATFQPDERPLPDARDAGRPGPPDDADVGRPRRRRRRDGPRTRPIRPIPRTTGRGSTWRSSARTTPASRCC